MDLPQTYLQISLRDTSDIKFHNILTNRTVKTFSSRYLGLQEKILLGEKHDHIYLTPICKHLLSIEAQILKIYLP